MNEQNEKCRNNFPERFGGYTVHHECTLGDSHRGTCVCRCGAREPERDTEPEEDPEDAPEVVEDAPAPEPDGGIIMAGKLHMGILGNWIGWEAQEGGDRRTPPVRMVRGGKLESFAISEVYMDPIIIVVSGEEYRVGPSQYFFWRKA